VTGDLSSILSELMLLASTTERQYFTIAIHRALRQVNPDRLQNGLQSSHPKCWSALVCYVGTLSTALLSIHDNHITPRSKCVSNFVNLLGA